MSTSQIAAVICGVVLISCYLGMIVFVRRKQKKSKATPELADGIALLLSSVGIFGVIDFWRMFSTTDMPNELRQYNQYFIVASLALTWLAISSIFKTFDKLYRKVPKK